MVRPLHMRDIELQGLQGKCAALVEHPKFIQFITLLILINAIALGLETDAELAATYKTFFHIFDFGVLPIFVIELLLKLYAYRLLFFRVGWNVFDFIIVAISLIPNSGGLAVLRALRVLRVFRLITLIPQMRRVIGALFHAIPGMASIIGILLVIIYVSAVLATQIFGAHPDPHLTKYFGTVGQSMYSMFQLMTLEDWPDIADPTIAIFPWAWAFFIPYILITSFAVLNLFIGIIVDALHIVKEDDLVNEEKKQTQELKDDISAIRHQLHDIQQKLHQIGR